MNTVLIKGTYAQAKVFSTEKHPLEHYASAQIRMICNNDASQGSSIRIMPDVHPGKVGPIGLTMTVTDRVLPALVGVDIGCGVSLTELDGFRPDFKRLDVLLRDNVPSGHDVKRSVKAGVKEFPFELLSCCRHINKEKARCSIGTLGGGNHFIEIDRSEDGSTFLTIHTGSRHLGKEVAEFYLREGQRSLKARGETVPYEMTWLDDALLEDYLHDIQIVQDFAEKNRRAITDAVTRGMKWSVAQYNDCAHNYIEKTDDVYMLRKGAISAKCGEPVIIPANMRDGVIVGIGKGNPDWNCSAPHGTGRIASRSQVKEEHTVSEYKKEMSGIYSPSIGKETLDEAPFAYRPLEEVADAIGDTVEVTKVLKPLYCFKNGGNK